MKDTKEGGSETANIGVKIEEELRIETPEFQSRTSEESEYRGRAIGPN